MDLISREESIKMLKACSLDETKFNYYRLHLEAVPTVEAKEVAHGKWIYGKNHGEFVEAECSACNGLLLVKWYDKLSEYNYCPKCGADMRTSAE